MQQYRDFTNRQRPFIGFLKYSMLLVLMFACAACGGKNIFNKGKAANAEKQQAQSTGDITRPPEVVKGARQSEAALDPDETVSYEKWKREQSSAEDEE